MVEPLLLSSLHQMLVVYLPSREPLTLCRIITAYDPNGKNRTCTTENMGYWSTNGGMVADGYISQITTMDDGIRLLSITGLNSQILQTCPYRDLELNLQQYIYLWSTTKSGPFCRVRSTDGSVITYDPITHVKDMQNATDVGPSVNYIIQAYADNLKYITVTDMNNVCSQSMTYSDMTQEIFSSLCGCYINLPTDQFSTDERQFLLNNPQCLPSCLQARVRYAPSGIPRTCQQDICIVDDVNVRGPTASIRQVCSQCSHQFECVCYVHANVNGQVQDTQACSQISNVSQAGNVTSTTHNGSSGKFSSLWTALKQAFRKKTVWIVIGVIAVVLIAVIVTFMTIRWKNGHVIK
jgi:hypothetical protein